MKKEKGGRPPLQKDFMATDIGDGILNISAPPVGFQEYMIIGTERALLIDTGMGIGSLRTFVESLTDLPVVLVNTHGHPDHCGGNAEFGPAILNPADFDVYHQMATREFREGDVAGMPGDVNWAELLQPTGPEPVPARDGQIIDIGGRQFRILFTPGHTHGSLCIYEEATQTLFAGDSIMNGTTTVREWNSSSVEELHDSLVMLAQLPIRRICGGHRPNINTKDLLEKEIRVAEDILAGAKGEESSFRGLTICRYERDGISIEYRPDHVRA